MKPQQILLALRAHYKVAMATFILVLVVGAVISWRMPVIYSATTSLVFDVKSPDPVAATARAPVDKGYMATQIAIIKSDRLAQRVVESLRLDQNPKMIENWKDQTKGKVNIQQWLGERIQKGLSLAESKGTNIIEITFYAGDPDFATSLANAYAEAYISTNLELKVDPARQYAAWFSEQAKVMRENLEKAQDKLSEYQKQKGIVAKEGELDTEMTKLGDLVAQLTASQAQTVQLQSKIRSSTETLAEFSEGSVIQSLKTDIARQEVKLRQAGENFGSNHPQYQRMEAELAATKAQLEVEKQSVARGLSTSRSITRDNESQLRGAIEAQKRKLLGLKSGQDELAVLQRDVDAARNAYDSVTKRYNQTSLESQVDQSNVSVLNPAVVPDNPSSPDNRKNMMITLLAGIVLGALAAIVMEYLDRRVRSVQDLEEMLQVPVLGVISPQRNSNKLTNLAHQMLRLEFK